MREFAAMPEVGQREKNCVAHVMVSMVVAFAYNTHSYQRRSCHFCIPRYSDTAGCVNVVSHYLSRHGGGVLLSA